MSNFENIGTPTMCLQLTKLKTSEMKKEKMNNKIDQSVSDHYRRKFSLSRSLSVCVNVALRVALHWSEREIKSENSL